MECLDLLQLQNLFTADEKAEHVRSGLQASPGSGRKTAFQGNHAVTAPQVQEVRDRISFLKTLESREKPHLHLENDNGDATNR